MQKRVAVAGFLGFFIIGAVQALYGPAIPQFLHVFHLTKASVGLAVSCQFLGTVIGIMLSGLSERGGFKTNHRLVISCACLIGGLLMFALAPSWGVALTGAAIAGLGYGGIDININLLFATSFGRRSAVMLNLVNAAFGVGAIAGPILVAVAPGGDYRWSFAALAALSVVMLPMVLTARDAPIEDAAIRPARSAGSLLVLTGLFIAAYFVYVGVETGVSGWETRFLQELNLVPVAMAAALPSLFWAALTAGRLLAVVVSRFAKAKVIVVASMTLGVFCLALAHFTGISAIAFTAAGFFLGPVFPTGLAWLGEHVSIAGGTLALVVSAAAFGGVVFPPIIGGLFDTYGPLVVPTVLSALGAICVLLFVGLLRFRHARTAEAGA